MYDQGWIPELENEHYRDLITFQDQVGEQFVYEFSQVNSRIYEEAKRPTDKDIDTITSENYRDGKSDIEKVRYYRQSTNDCCAQGVGRGIADFLQTGAYKNKEIKGFNAYIPWLYGMYHQKIVGKPSNRGCSVSGMMNLINRYGILPDDISGLPTYENSIKTWSGNKTTGMNAYEKYKDVAEKFQVKTARLGRSVDDIIACCKAGYTVPFGTSIRCSLRNGYWQPGGNWMHAMEFACNKNDDIYLTNSHGEMKAGLVTKTVLKQLISGRYFDAFVILDIERERKGKANWSLI